MHYIEAKTILSAKNEQLHLTERKNMTLEELKIRQLTNQYLLAPADKLTVMRDLCGVQAQFMTNALHSLKIRTNDYDEQTVADGLVKNWSVRGTVHVFAESDLPLFIRCNNGADYRKNEWQGYSYMKNQRPCWALTPERQKCLADIILAAVSERAYTRDELKELCRANGMTKIEEDCMFESWGGGIRELCVRGFMNYTVQEKKQYIASPEFSPIPEEEAKFEIARRYFTNIAPATIHDAMYYTGAKQAEVKNWLQNLPVESFDFGGRTYYYIPNGKTYDGDIPHCIFLAGFDQLMLGYQKKESIYLKPEYLRGVFNLAGIVMPPLLIDGDVAGIWKNKNGKLEIKCFRSLTQTEKSYIEQAADKLWGDIKEVKYKEG